MSRLFEYESGFYASGGASAVKGGVRICAEFVASNDDEYNQLKDALRELDFNPVEECTKNTSLFPDTCFHIDKVNDANRMIRVCLCDLIPLAQAQAHWDNTNTLMEEIKERVPGETTIDFAPGPYIDAVIYNIYGTMSAAALAVIAGDVDFHLNPLGYELGLRRQLEEAENVEVIVNTSNGFYYLSWNMRKPPFNNLYFRKAIDCVIDREYVTEQLLQGVAYPGYTPVPPGNGYWYKPPSEEEKDARCIGFSEAEKVARAVEYLKQGGFTWEVEPQVNPDGTVTPGRGIMLNGELIPELELIHPNAAYDNRRNIFGLHVAKRANILGIPVRSVPTGFNVIVSRVFVEQDFDMWELGWGLGIYPDYLHAFFHSAFAEPGGFNPEGYMNPEFDALADAFIAEQDLVKAKELALQMQEFLAQDLPYAVLFYSPVYEAYRSDRVVYPYTETLDGLQAVNGLIGSVKLVE